MLLSVLMKSFRLYLPHTHTNTCTNMGMYTLIIVVSLLPSGSPDRCGSHTQTHIDKHSQTHKRSLAHSHMHTRTHKHTHTVGPTGHFPYPGTAQWALCTPSHLPTPPLTINPPPASSTSLFKWEIMQMSSHHRGTPHISDVHSVKSVVCLWEHVWESAHECLYSLRDGCVLNTQQTSQVLEPHHKILLLSFTSRNILLLLFMFDTPPPKKLFYLKYVSKILAYSSKNTSCARRQIAGRLRK